jgi:hypothetical protein
MSNRTSLPPEPRWWSAVPSAIAESLLNVPVVGVGFAAGPSFIAGKSHRFDPLGTFEDARVWLQPFDRSLHRCSVEYLDGTILYFERGGTFFKASTVAKGRTSAGVTVVHPPE